MSAGSDYEDILPSRAVQFCRRRNENTLGCMRTETIATARRSRASNGARRRSSLTAICMTAGPGPRVAAILGVLRRDADEIVVALDSSADADVRRDLECVADRIVIYPYAEPVDRPIPWLFHECSTDWALFLDDDEIPSVALTAALPDLIADTGVTHYWLPRKWLYPTSATYLDETPWRPDYQPRLVRTDPRFVRFSDEFHRPIVVSGPGRYPQLPLWHADPVLRTPEQRREKARRYEQTRPGMRVGARALNFAFYLPESADGPTLADVPPEERVRIEAVLGAARPAGAPGAEVRHATREEIDAWWPDTGAASQGGRCEVLDRVAELVAGEQRTVDVLVRNTGSGTWPWGWESVPEVRLGSRWFDADGVEVRAVQLRTAFPAALAPGHTDVVPVHLLAPDLPGAYRVEVDLIHEHARWFESGESWDVVVRPRRRIAVMGRGGAAAQIARLLESLPELEPVVLGPQDGTPGEGYAAAPSNGAYLLLDAPARGARLAATVAGRTLRLAAAVEARRLGRRIWLPREGATFVEAIAEADLFVLAELESSPFRRELWRAATSVRAAVALGVPVAVHRDVLALGGPMFRLAVGRSAVLFDHPEELLPLLARRS